MFLCQIRKGATFFVELRTISSAATDFPVLAPHSSHLLLQLMIASYVGLNDTLLRVTLATCGIALFIFELNIAGNHASCQQHFYFA